MTTKKQNTTIIKASIIDTKDLYLEEQANDLLKIAKEKGLNKNYVFNTTFNRYLTQIELLRLLKNDFANNCKTTVKKEYVKGRETITAHPLIAKINSTIDSANKTATLLVKMLIQKELEIKEHKISLEDLFFMNANEVIQSLGTDKQKKANLNRREREELADKLKEEYKEKLEKEKEFNFD